jgi:putative endonuclease
MTKPGYFYIMCNAQNTVLYCGATDDLIRRVNEHKNGVYTNSFTARYNINKLVYFVSFTYISDAFAREKQVKGGSRKKKIDLVERVNPEWIDLFDRIAQNKGEELNRIISLLRPR